MDVGEFDYYLPPELIAQHPVAKRDHSRLLFLQRDTGRIEHTQFFNIQKYLYPGDLLVVNDTKVRPARLCGHKETGGRVTVLLLEPLSALHYADKNNVWEALIDCSKNPRIGSILFFSPQLEAEVIRYKGGGLWDIQLFFEGDLDLLLEKVGKTPLPPYIKRGHFACDSEDRWCYQTVFAEKVGSAAAPTAGLHFTENLINLIRQKGVDILTVTLHVGLGTFQPLRVNAVEEHHMHREYYEVTPETAQTLARALDEGRRVIACGTTSVRVTETLRNKPDSLKGFTDIFIYPGYVFKTIKGLITNFHLPRSTLLMLVSAFAGKEYILRAYQEAIAEQYRFYSYGDAMLIM